MLSYVDYLMGWAEAWASAGREAPSVRGGRSDHATGQRAAWAVVDGIEIAGQITVWETGECELEAYRIETSEAVLLEHRQIDSLVGLQDAIQMVLGACEGDVE